MKGASMLHMGSHAAGRPTTFSEVLGIAHNRGEIICSESPGSIPTNAATPMTAMESCSVPISDRVMHNVICHASLFSNLTNIAHAAQDHRDYF
mmetsp:Transcript_64503/g.179482  ORF Transcript_64503/g.179482 Transcript_64503/m.179482 type:complete len:93 (+) Transcript_64503:54-332(+)